MVQRDFPISGYLGHPCLAGPLGLVNWLVASLAIVHYFVSCNPFNLVGGLEHFLFSVYWEFHHPN